MTNEEFEEGRWGESPILGELRQVPCPAQTPSSSLLPCITHVPLHPLSQAVLLAVCMHAKSLQLIHSVRPYGP